MTELANESHTKVLVCDNVSEELTGRLNDEGYSVEYEPLITKDRLLKEIPEYDIIVVRSRTKVTSEILKAAKKLKIIARAGIGTDNIDLHAAESMGIRIVTAAGASTKSVVELNLLLSLEMARKAYALNIELRNGKYTKQKGREISGSTCGIIGFGRIGYETAKALSNLGANIIAYDIVRNDEHISAVNGRYVELNNLISASDFIFTCVTLNESSQTLIGKNEIDNVKRGSIIINTSRAEAFDGISLLGALKSGRVGGYAADVLWNEPPSEEFENELIALDNVFITPHIGAQTEEGQRRVAITTAENIVKTVRGGI